MSATGAAAGGRFVGIDVVDLADPRCAGKHADERFLRRVLAETERETLAAAADPVVALWRLWAAKEAAFKVASKLRGAPPPFVHAAFQVTALESGDGFGSVAWEDLSVRIHWHEEPGRVAALGWDGIAAEEPVEWGWGAAGDLDPNPGAPLDILLARLTDRERRPVHSRGSALVRLAARATLAQALAVDELRIEVVCNEGPRGRIPPHVLLDGAPAPADVSLSHHGRWLAWGVRLTAPRPRGGAPPPTT